MNRDLVIDNLTVDFRGPKGIASVIDDCSLTIPQGSRMALVGESGSGKTVIAKTILGLLPANATVSAGTIRFGTSTVMQGGQRQKTSVRGREIAMIFQNPKSSLNPIRKVGRQIEDVLRQHVGLAGKEAKDAAVEALASVRLPDPHRVYNAFPYELSGGMAQRALIAVALACKPSLLIADEPTTGLDVSLQREIMDLIQAISATRGMSLLLITHDLAVAREYCSFVCVMHAGHIVEKCPVGPLFQHPTHPYTKALIRSTPNEIESLGDLRPIQGTLPDLYTQLPACRFLYRCERRQAVCEGRPPIAYQAIDRDHTVLCRRPI